MIFFVADVTEKLWIWSDRLSLALCGEQMLVPTSRAHKTRVTTPHTPDVPHIKL